MADRAPPNLPPLIDNPLAPEFFADEATGFFVHQGNLSITFSSARVDHRSDPGPVSRGCRPSGAARCCGCGAGGGALRFPEKDGDRDARASGALRRGPWDATRNRNGAVAEGAAGAFA